MRFASIRAPITAILLATLAALNVACDGRAGFSPPDEEAGGVYIGSLAAEVNGVPTILPLFGAITENNELQLIGPDVHLAGPVTVSQVKFDAKLTAYTGMAGRFFGMDGTESVVLDGHMAGQSGANGQFAAPGVVGTFNLTYDPISAQFASLDFTAGTWTYVDGGYTATFNVDATGLVAGNDSDGCTFSGQLTVNNPQLNVYTLAVSISNCGMYNGDFGGLVFLASVGGVDLDQMTLGISNDMSAYSVVLDKL